MGQRRSGGDAFLTWADACRADLDSPLEGIGDAAARLVERTGALPGALTVAQQDMARSLLHALWHRLLAVLIPVGPSAPSGAATPRDPRAACALAEISRRFAEPSLRLRSVAKQLAVSDCRLTHLLKESTGATFGAHLHARRVAEARGLLVESSLSVKEIAGRVGYSTTTQLDRHFKRRVRMLPSEYRASARAARECDEAALRVG